MLSWPWTVQLLPSAATRPTTRARTLLRSTLSFSSLLARTAACRARRPSVGRPPDRGGKHAAASARRCAGIRCRPSDARVHQSDLRAANGAVSLHDTRTGARTWPVAHSRGLSHFRARTQAIKGCTKVTFHPARGHTGQARQRRRGLQLREPVCHPLEPRRHPRRNRDLAAFGAIRTKDTHLAARCKRLTARRGPLRALATVEHSIITAIRHMPTDNAGPTRNSAAPTSPGATPNAPPAERSPSPTSSPTPPPQPQGNHSLIANPRHPRTPRRPPDTQPCPHPP